MKLDFFFMFKVEVILCHLRVQFWDIMGRYGRITLEITKGLGLLFKWKKLLNEVKAFPLLPTLTLIMNCNTFMELTQLLS